MHVFPLFEKLLFIQLDRFLTDPRQITIYRDPWTSFLDRFYRIFKPSSYLEFVSIASQQILDPSRKFLSGRQLLDSYSIHQDIFAVNIFESRQILNHTSTDSIYRDLVLDRSRQILDPSSCDLFKQLQREINFHFSHYLLTETIFHLPNTLLSLKTSYSLGFWPSLSIFPMVCFSNPSFFMHFTHLDLGFGFL